MSAKTGPEARVREIRRKTRRQYSSEVTTLRQENGQLKHLVAGLALRNQLLKKSLAGLGEGVEDA